MFNPNIEIHSEYEAYANTVTQREWWEYLDADSAQIAAYENDLLHFEDNVDFIFDPYADSAYNGSDV